MGNSSSLICLKKNKGRDSPLPQRPPPLCKISRRCKICFQIYDYDKHFPMLLSKCGHTFCRDCAFELNKCALCKQLSQAGQLVKNYQILELEQDEQNHTTAQSPGLANCQNTKENPREASMKRKVLKKTAMKLLSEKQYQTALELLNKYLERTINDDNSLGLKARCLFKLERFSQAKEILSYLIQNHPNHSSFFKSRGVCNAKLGENNAAVDDFTKAIEISAQASYYKKRAEAYADLRNYQRALSDLNVAITINPKKPAFYELRAEIYSKLGYVEQAKADFVRVKGGNDAESQLVRFPDIS